DPVRRVEGNLNLSFEGVEAERLIGLLEDVAVSTGSACTSASVEPSYVLQALGMSSARANASLRIGIGRFTTQQEIDFAADRIADCVEALRKPGQPIKGAAE